MLHRPVHDDDLERSALPADHQPAGRLDDLCRGRELRSHRSSRHWVADYRRRSRNLAAIAHPVRWRPDSAGARAETRCSLSAVADSRDEGPGPAGDPVEIEWQFDALDLRPVERWLATLPTLAVETGDGGTVTALARTPRRLVDSYLDTDDWRIARAGFVVRTRQRGRHDEVTLKDTRPAEGSGLRQRLEVTEVLPPSGVGALGAEGPVGRRLRAVVGSRRLREVLQVRTRRRPFALRVGGVDAAEVALDDTMIVVGNGQRPMQLRRVEVEVRPEWLDALEPIVEQLRASCGLQPAKLSKFEAGLLALGHEIPGSPDLGPTDDLRVVDHGRSGLRRASPPVGRAAREGTGHAAGRGSRGAARHAGGDATPARRASPCSPTVLPVRAQVFREELGWLGRLLGAVRDLDVQLEGLAEMATATVAWSAGARPVDHDPLAELTALLERERDAARAAMLSGLDSVRWERLAKGWPPWCNRVRRAARWPPGSPPSSPCPTSSWRATRRSPRQPGGPRSRAWCPTSTACASAASGSATRSSSAREVYGGRTSRFVRQLTALQDELGLMQDAEVASIQLADLATGEAHLPRRDGLRDGRHGGTAPARREPAPAPPAQGTAPDRRARVA